CSQTGLSAAGDALRGRPCFPPGNRGLSLILGLLRFDVRLFHDLAPGLVLALDVAAELRGRHGLRLDASLRQCRDHFWIGQCFTNVASESINDFLRRLRRGEIAVPVERLVAWVA